MFYKLEENRTLFIYPFEGELRKIANRVTNLLEASDFFIRLVEENYELNSEENKSFKSNCKLLVGRTFVRPIIEASKNPEFVREAFQTWFPNLNKIELDNFIKNYQKPVICLGNNIIHLCNKFLYYDGLLFGKDNDSNSTIPIFALDDLMDNEIGGPTGSLICIYNKDGLEKALKYHEEYMNDLKTESYINPGKYKSIEYKTRL